MNALRWIGKSLAFALALVFLVTMAVAQETTGGLQGTVKDEKGSVVSKAVVVLSGTSLVGNKNLQTDASGYYRFANLPPGSYTLTVKSEGFATMKRDGITIEVGHLPTLDLTLKVGSQSTVVEVTAEAPLIDVTTSTTATNITNDVVQDVPHGRSFQSVIQFAPAARNEPLAGQTGGTGGSLPGSSGNGLGYGYSVGGASDSENAYLVEGQDTENISAGYSKANVPFEFVQEVQVKTSGIEAEHGGALGGVVNVIMKKGSNNWHGQLFGNYESAATDASPHNYLRYDPNGVVNYGTGGNAGFDEDIQYYQPKQDHFRNIQTGGVIGGPIVKDRLWVAAGLAPQYVSDSRAVDFSSQDASLGVQTFTQDTQFYYGMLRFDAAITSKIRAFASWLTQSSRQQGVLPYADDKNGLYNAVGLGTPFSGYAHGIGYYAPNQTFNFGGDVTITPQLISTTRFGYFFENYHDFGWQTSTPSFYWAVAGTVDAYGNALPANNASGLTESAYYSTASYNESYTQKNANKHFQFDEDVAYFKSGWAGTHNFKFGYQFNRLNNDINQHYSVPYAEVVPGKHGYSAMTAGGAAVCASLESTNSLTKCEGNYGYVEFVDFGTIGKATDNNHSIFAQDAWQLGKGVTLNLGIRVEKEILPTPAGSSSLAGHDINFSWSDKIEPRLGGAWDILQNGKYKLFGSYGVTNDIMKLLVAQTSWGSQHYDTCTYGISSPFTVSSMDPVFVNGAACPEGSTTAGVNWASGSTPAGMTLIENFNWRPWEPVANGTKPYRQHESVFGLDTEISKDLAFEVRWDRHRLDHVIEDMSLSDVNWGELYAIGNPGEGVNKTIDSYATYLHSLGQSFGTPGMSFDLADFGTCPSCPANPKAVRSYDGLEFRLTKKMSHRWTGMASYTWSSLRGNYTGLTTTDQSDGGAAGRASANTTRSFDEPFYYFTDTGKSANGPLPTDRPNTFKGFVYYTQPWNKRQSSTIGLFQIAYQGTPVSTYADIGSTQIGSPLEATYLFGRGKWANVSQDADGNITINSISNKRTPWLSQSDLNFRHEIKIDTNEGGRSVVFEATVNNLFNQQAVTAYRASLNAWNAGTGVYPGGQTIYGGAAAYQAFETGYNAQSTITADGVILSNQYGKPVSWQSPRTVRLALRYIF
ncbi:MAG: TonB-dependent receptor [Acidobacteriota bacterium]|nr:TonB-dependent receptor [Acidobacteriota bacterium]